MLHIFSLNTCFEVWEGFSHSNYIYTTKDVQLDLNIRIMEVKQSFDVIFFKVILIKLASVFGVVVVLILMDLSKRTDFYLIFYRTHPSIVL